MSYKVFVVAALAAVAVTDKVSHEDYDPDPYHNPGYDGGSSYHDPGYGKGSSYHDRYNKKPEYDFHYTVKDKYYNDYGHWEHRDGYVTKGKYFVLLPDYRKQTVDYTVDGKKGYVATVTYSQDPKHKHPKGGHSHGSYKHDSYKPDSYEHDSYKPKSYKPRTYKPDSYEHDSYKPDSYEHDSYKSKSYEHDSYKPKSYKPESYEHDSYKPSPYY